MSRYLDWMVHDMATHSKTELLSMNALSEAAACLKVMAHPIRLRIVELLMSGNFAVHEIADLCGLRQHQVCEHLRLMQNCGLLTSNRQGRAVYYSIVSPQLPALIGCIREHCGQSE
jgi:DNA-binding transcriptional ArsR family regulator